MESRTTKFAISLPRETFNEVEHFRHELGLARSAAILEALRLWLRQKEEAELEERYVKGYRRKPEREGDIEPFFRAGLSSFTQENW